MGNYIVYSSPLILAYSPDVGTSHFRLNQPILSTREYRKTFDQEAGESVKTGLELEIGGRVFGWGLSQGFQLIKGVARYASQSEFSTLYSNSILSRGIVEAENYVVIKGGKITTQNGGYIDLPQIASMSKDSARQWYLNQEAVIQDLINISSPLEQQAQQAVQLRNAIRTAARNSMIDQETAAILNLNEPNMTWSQVLNKYSNMYSGDEVYRQIIMASQRSRTSVNQLLGVTSPSSIK
jgi:hypothetical protein